MRFLLISILTLVSLTAWADKPAVNSDNKFKNGDCFNYSDATVKRKVKLMVGRVESIDFSNFDLTGSIFVKAEGKKGYVTFKFSLPYLKQSKYSKVSCPKDLPVLTN